MVMDYFTPISVIAGFLSEPAFVFLESISENHKHDRFSYFGFDPFLTIEGHHNGVFLIYSDGRREEREQTIYDCLNELTDHYALTDNPDSLFSSGIMGTLSYECAQFCESVQVPEKRSLSTPIASFIIPRKLLIFDNLFNTLTLVCNVFQDDAIGQTQEARYETAVSELNALETRVAAKVEIQPLGDLVDPFEPICSTCSTGKADFLEKIERAKTYIREGDIFQVQISRRVSIEVDADPFMLYRYLRYQNPSPFLFYIKLNDMHLLGASPELLVDVEDRTMTIRPIAGTRKRFSKHRSESEIIDELINDEKEKAEHVMLVDLARHDIGRSCEYGSVRVEELMIIEKYSHVIHMVSDVKGHLRDNYSAIDALKFGFPAGTVSGAPKIRAMEIITELEDCQREFYSGGVIFADFRGNLKSTLTIRALLVKDSVAYTQAAAGVVADSIPEMEYKETENKMRACLSAMHKFRKKDN